MPVSLPILNAAEATFECIYGRGCEGLCCQQGRPPVPPKEAARITKVLRRVLPLLRPAARALIESSGFLSNRVKDGNRMLRVVGGWCVFFNEGCVLHKLGAADGDPFRYKPTDCSLFPLQQDERSRWYVRQRGYKGEGWELFCLDPAHSRRKAVDSLCDEIELAASIDAVSNGTSASGGVLPRRS